MGPHGSTDGEISLTGSSYFDWWNGSQSVLIFQINSIVGNGTSWLQERETVTHMFLTRIQCHIGYFWFACRCLNFFYIYIYMFIMGDLVSGLKQMQSLYLWRFTFISHLLPSCCFLWWLQYIRELTVHLEETWFVSYTLQMITLQSSTITYNRCNPVLTHTEERDPS